MYKDEIQLLIFIDLSNAIEPRKLTQELQKIKGLIIDDIMKRIRTSHIILKEYFENISLKSCNIAKVFAKLLERFLKYCRNLAMSVQNIINEILLQF